MAKPQSLDLELIQIRLPISPPLSPCIEDVELESLLNDTDNLLDEPTENKLESKSTSFLILLTIGMGGLQIVFSVIYSHGLTHLRSLGLDKSQTAITFIAGPLSGMFVQPCLGIWSDHSKFAWGRRKPFIAFGTIALVVSLLGLAWTTSIVNMLHSSPQNMTSHSEHTEPTSAIVGITLIFCVYIAIQPVQGGIRALIADACPTHQQQDANAWVSRISGSASVFGYLSAYLDLPRYISWFGDTQFKSLSVLAIVSLTLSVGLTCVYVPEKNPNIDSTKRHDEKLSGILHYNNLTQVGRIFHTFGTLPRQIWYILIVQFFAWMGWYPYLLYVSTYVGDIYLMTVQRGTSSTANYDRSWEHAARIGSLALLISSIISVVTASVLPALMRSPSSSRRSAKYKISRCCSKPIWSSWLTLRRIWTISHCLFAFCMLGTLFISSTAYTIMMFGFVGMGSAVANWIPYALLGVEISRSSEEDRRPMLPAGTILGLHNTVMCVPQIMISLGSSLFWKLDGDAQRRPESIAWVLRIGGVAALLAAWFTSNIKESEVDMDDALEEASQETSRTEY